ncbi:hypothetical protein LJR098_000063 [Rhizobium sp. LjRoot98]|uniref:hypothetical protein n=1 Tax=unclassified Rhizobium TaxID=2613769 RepID=UPI0012E3BDAF|nr:MULTISPECIES: hypothetical protein [unclassified Rhizobium]
MPGTVLHPDDNDRKAGDEHGDGGQSGEITNEVSHWLAPFPLCSYIVPYLFMRQAATANLLLPGNRDGKHFLTAFAAR